MSLIIEGGFPLRIIEHEHGRLRAYLIQVLRELDRCGGDSAIGAALAARFSGTLPASFRYPELYELVGELLATIIAFKDALPEDLRSQDPITILDTTHPEWRDELPLSVDDGPARNLIRALLKETVDLKRRARVLRTLCRRGLVRGEGGIWYPNLTLIMDGLLDPGMLPENGRALNDALRVRFLPGGALARRTVAPLALIRPTKEANEPWPIEPLSGGTRPVSFNFDEPAEIAAVVNGIEVAQFVPSGGEALGGNLFIFEALDDSDPDDVRDDEILPDRLGFLGIGSVSTRKPELYVAFNAEKIAFPNGLAEGAIAHIGTVADTPLELCRIKGRVSLQDAEDDLPIALKTETETDAAPRLLVEGRRPSWVVDAPDALIGEPHLWSLNLEGTRSPVRPEALRWKPANRRSWQPYPAGGLPSGEQEVALVLDETLADRRRFVVFPDVAEITALPTDSQHGSLRVSGMKHGLITLERSDSDQIAVERIEDANDSITFRFSCQSSPPPAARLNIAWDSARPIQVVVPFPVRGAGFLDSNEVWLPRNSTLSVDRLFGVRGRALGCGDTGARLFGDLRANDVTGRRPFIWRGFREEISLSALKPAFLRLFAASEDIDAEIRLEIDAGTETSRLTLKRFDVNLFRDDGYVRLREEDDQKLQEESATDIEIVARPLSDFSVDEKTLEANPGDHRFHPGWRLPLEEHTQHSYLIFGRIDGRYRIRPQVFAAADKGADILETADIEATPLGLIADIPDPTARHRALRDRFCVLAAKPDDPDWRALDAALDAMQGRLPLTTLDYFDALVGVPEATLCFLAQASSSRIERIISIEDELPFLWGLLPLMLWPEIFTRVADARKDTLIDAGVDTGTALSIVSEQMQDLLDHLSIAEPMLRTQIAQTRLAIGIPLRPDELSPQIAATPQFAEILADQLGELRMECLRRNDATHWPQFFDFRETFAHLPSEHLNVAGYQTKVLDAPFAAAIVACNGEVASPDLSQSVKEYREFDRTYFDDSYTRALVLECAKSIGRQGKK